MKTIIGLAAAVVATALLPGRATAQAGPCQRVTYEHNAYTVCEVDLQKNAVRLYWRRPDGSPYAYLRSLPTSLETQAGALLFATNAGMFDPAFRPVGLYVEGGRELVRPNTRAGYGNFHMKPNGVFYVAGDKAGVLETSAYLKARPSADLATQSGPMLVINGRLHPKFDHASLSLKPRNGVGVRTPDAIVFAISEGQVSFAAFARLFRDRLQCRNALFLDGGTAASLYVPASHGGNFLPLGPMLAVFNKTSDSPR